MFTRLKPTFVFLIMAAALNVVVPAGAQTLAIFPVEDLSIGVNSPNLELTGDIAEKIREKGLEVIAEEEVLAFMAAKHVRWLGYLPTELLMQARESLGADYIVFGTVSQGRDKRSPSFGLTLNIFRTLDAQSVWTSTGGLSLADMQRLLGLNEPASLEELWPILVNDVLASWPSGLSAGDKPLQFNLMEGEQPPVLQVKKVSLTPRYVKPGEAVKCVVELEDGLIPDSERPQVYIRAGNRVHLARQAPEALFYEASWTGSEIEQEQFREVGSEFVRLAATELEPQVFEGIWTGTQEDDVYPVNIILRWPTGMQQAAYVGTYTVDSRPPDIDLFLKAREIDGVAAFSDKILIVPKYQAREKLDHWQISVKNFNGEEIIGTEGEGNLPRSFFWKGQYYDGLKAKEGYYQMILQVWDRAGNKTTVSKDVAYRPDPPEIIVEIEQQGPNLLFRLAQGDGQLPLSYWQYEVWSPDGYFVKTDSGQKLPVEYLVPNHPDQKSSGIEGAITYMDVLGNKTKLDLDDLDLMAFYRNVEEPAAKEVTGEPVKDDPGDWLTKF